MKDRGGEGKVCEDGESEGWKHSSTGAGGAFSLWASECPWPG